MYCQLGSSCDMCASSTGSQGTKRAAMKSSHDLKGLRMKKTAFALVAVATLGLAACQPSADETTNNAADLNISVNETEVDVNAAAGDAANSSLDSVGNAIENTAADVGNAAEDAGNAVENAVD